MEGSGRAKSNTPETRDPGAPANQAADTAAWKRPAAAPGSPQARPVDTAGPRLQSSGLTPAGHRPLRGGGGEHAEDTRPHSRLTAVQSCSKHCGRLRWSRAGREQRPCGGRRTVEGGLTVPALCWEPRSPGFQPSAPPTPYFPTPPTPVPLRAARHLGDLRTCCIRARGHWERQWHHGPRETALSRHSPGQVLAAAWVR